MKKMNGIIKRDIRNPIIKPEDVPGGCRGIYNSAIIKSEDKLFKGVFRVDGKDGIPRLHKGESKDGIKFKVDAESIKFKNQREGHAVGDAYDPKITEIEGIYYITFANDGVIGIAKTIDFKNFEFLCNASVPRNRNCVLFPEKINGFYVRLERPFFDPHKDQADIWFSKSPDLVFWGDFHLVMRPKGWAGFKIGPGAPPIKTKEGWLEIYHGVHKSCSGLVYSMGLVLLNLERPWEVLHRAEKYLLGPEMEYERIGLVPNVVFPTAAILEEASQKVSIYYGAADTYVCVAYAQLNDLVDFCIRE